MTIDRSPTRGWGALLVAVVAAAVFIPSLANGFAYDDVAIILGDPRVQGPGGLGRIFTEGYWGDDQLALYRPLTTLSFAIDWLTGSGGAAWFHLVNVIWHAAVSALVFLLLARWFRLGAALAGGLLFAVHPVHVEAVANVVGRGELLAAAAVLSALLLWLYEPGPRMRVVRSVGVAVLLGLGLAAKESALVLLPLILLIDIAERRLTIARAGEWLRANLVALVASIAVVGAWIATRIAVLGGMAPATVDAAFDVATGLDRVTTALQAWPIWARLLVAPTTLLADYGPRVLMPADATGTATILGALLLATLVCVGLVELGKGHTRTAIGLLWFPVAIAPVSNLLVATGVIVAERTLYLPSLALCMLVAAGVEAAAQPTLAARMLRPATFALALLLGMFTGRSLARIPEWTSTETLYAAQLRDRPDSFRAQWYMAREAKDRGDFAGAAGRYDQAVALWPYRLRLNVEAAAFNAEHGRLERAREIAAFTLDRHPEDLAALRILAATTLDLGDSTSARLTVREALRIHPDDDVLRRMDAALNPRAETQ